MLLAPHDPAAPTTRRPWRVLLALAGAVAVVHLALWQGMADSWAASDPPEPARTALRVRSVAPAVQPASAPAPRAAPSAARPRRVAPNPQPAPSEEAPAPAEQVAAAAPATAPLIELTPVAARAARGELPVYRTQMPPAITLNYQMRSGGLSGNGELQWRPEGQGYEARLEGRVFGFSVLSWVSQGGFDAAGIAPLRYTDQRRGRSMQAANFQRKAGKISFSGPSTEYPLPQGAQDRLSWMVQIAAIAAADPQRLAPGARVAMFVAGARGDADVWAFQVLGVEDVATGDATVRAIKLLREPRKPHDTRVEVWLAPSLHHLPVRARLVSDGSSLELLLQTAQPAS